MKRVLGEAIVGCIDEVRDTKTALRIHGALMALGIAGPVKIYNTDTGVVHETFPRRVGLMDLGNLGARERIRIYYIVRFKESSTEKDRDQQRVWVNMLIAGLQNIAACA